MLLRPANSGGWGRWWGKSGLLLLVTAAVFGLWSLGDQLRRPRTDAEEFRKAMAVVHTLAQVADAQHAACTGIRPGSATAEQVKEAALSASTPTETPSTTDVHATLLRLETLVQRQGQHILDSFGQVVGILPNASTSRSSTEGDASGSGTASGAVSKAAASIGTAADGGAARQSLSEAVSSSKAITAARASLASYTGEGIPKIIHQMYGLYGDRSDALPSGPDTFKKLNPDHVHIIWGPEDVHAFVAAYFPAIAPTFGRLKLPVLKADLARYLIIFTFGGVYSDIDTTCLKPIKAWTGSVQGVNIVVGVEADAKDIAGWAKHWGRQLQISQWTFASVPGHPVLATTVYRVGKLLASIGPEKVENNQVTHTTGPSVFTDAVYDYLATQHKDWKQLLGMQTATKVGDLYMLTITGFSPGVGHMGAGGVLDPRAMVQHGFQGSWTGQQP